MLFWLLSEMSNVVQIPFALTYTFIMLFYILGFSFFAGIGVFVVAFLFNLVVGRILQKKQKKIMNAKDARMNHTSEALTNIKNLKLYSWTLAF
jgi:ABC-type bacteriocin/lantibiotic exporter with double-glycine peptidase domain